MECEIYAESLITHLHVEQRLRIYGVLLPVIYIYTPFYGVVLKQTNTSLYSFKKDEWKRKIIRSENYTELLVLFG
jgi:hypothetical protein